MTCRAILLYFLISRAHNGIRMFMINSWYLENHTIRKELWENIKMLHKELTLLWYLHIPQGCYLCTFSWKMYIVLWAKNIMLSNSPYLAYFDICYLKDKSREKWQSLKSALVHTINLSTEITPCIPKSCQMYTLGNKGFRENPLRFFTAHQIIEQH
jgi:hypothetical protein